MFLVARYNETKLDFLLKIVDRLDNIKIINFSKTIKSNVEVIDGYNYNYGYLINLIEFIISKYDNLPNNIIFFQLENNNNSEKILKNLEEIDRKIKEENYNILNPIFFCKPIIKYIDNTINISQFSKEILNFDLDFNIVLPIWNNDDIMVLSKENLYKRPKEDYIKILENIKKNYENLPNLFVLFSKVIGY
jgi:hypothetical protein